MEAKQLPSVSALIVDKLRYMDEAELKLAYVKLFRKELEEEWKNIKSIQERILAPLRPERGWGEAKQAAERFYHFYRIQ